MAGELRDYDAWHGDYDDPASGLSWRLRTVQRYIKDVLDERDPPLRVLSVCAGDGRDVIGVLAERADAARVHATLLEIHPAIAERARRSAAAAGLSGRVDVRTVDAGDSDAYLTLPPADLVLLVGIFGNISDEDLQRTIVASAELCADRAAVLWSRGRGRTLVDRNDAVRAWFRAAGFTELDYAVSDRGHRPALGRVRYDGPQRPLQPGQRWFTFRR
ncbi:MAG: class I SAM-dependent methyltransferase family protein [bacterium]